MLSAGKYLALVWWVDDRRKKGPALGDSQSSGPVWIRRDEVLLTRQNLHLLFLDYVGAHRSQHPDQGGFLR